MKIEVILPVAQYDMALDLLEKIDQNTTTPSDVHVIDNTGFTHFWMLPDNFNLLFLSSTTGRLNESWEIARAKLSPDTDYVTFFNDDIIIGDWFFQRTIETFKAVGNCGIVCANIVKTPKEVKKGKVRHVVGDDKRIKACAFTIRKDILDKIPSIPWERITTFYGDNWVWAHTTRMGYCWAMDMGNNVYHYVGKTVLERGFRSIKKKEYNEWELIKKEVWGI